MTKELDIFVASSLKRLGLERLNEMQRQALSVCCKARTDVVLYSPTGSGKTLAIALPVLYGMSSADYVQAVVIAPSRELTRQLYEVFRVAGDGIKVTPCYGGHSALDERNSLSATPAVVIGTPGRLLDHLRRGDFDASQVSTLVLDEFDKSLELGFEDEMRAVLGYMKKVKRRFLTSATRLDPIPAFVGLSEVNKLDFIKDSQLPQQLDTWLVKAKGPDKQRTLKRLLLSLPPGKTIVFVNYREAVEKVHKYLASKDIDSGTYHGALDQIEREKALALFDNGTHPVLVATDLASRGLDLDTVEHIIHFHLPATVEAWIHRNGRSARVGKSGNAYLLLGNDEQMPEFVGIEREYVPQPMHRVLKAYMATLYFPMGRKEKISRGDILGFISANGSELVTAADIGKIKVMDHYSLAAVPRATAQTLASTLTGCRLKSRKVKVTLTK